MMSKQYALSLAVLSLATAGSVAVVATASADEHEPFPEHGHMLLLDATLEFVDDEPVVTYGKCRDLAAGQALGLNAHHEHLHFGRAGEAQRTAGNVVVPTAPFFDLPWTNCAEFATFFPAD